MGDLPGLDLAVIVVYFVAITAFGASLGRFTRSTRDFFLAGQRFPAWLVAFSCVATVVGSYSFIKYSAVGFQYGLASSQTYLNDWFWMPLFLFGWLPILYHARVLSVPEYFRRRFDRRTGVAATAVLLLYLIGYIGINLFTLGTALQTLFGIDVFWMALTVTLLCMVYEWTGGQTSVIFTDFAQSVWLLAAGLIVVVLGLSRLGGLSGWLDALPAGFTRPLPAFNDSPAFNFVGIFWQDGLAGGVAFYFMNQGMLMRFLSARSVATARRAGAIVLLLLMPLAAVAVSGAGWVGAGLAGQGELATDTRPDQVFVVVARLLCAPGVFGLVMAALLAALMSTVDTLINASSALLVNDVYRPLLRPGRDERHYLRSARWMSVVAAGAGLALVPLYRSFDTIYEAHGAFVAAITPPMVVALLLAFLWPRFSATAALTTLVGGTALMLVSLKFPQVVAPFDHGIPADGGYKYVRACYGVAVSGALAVVVTLLAPSRERRQSPLTLRGLATRRRVGAAAARGVRVRTRVHAIERVAGALDAPAPPIRLADEVRRELGAAVGDIVFVDDARWWLGGLRSARCRVAELSPARAGVAAAIPAALMRSQGWSEGQSVVLEVLE